MLVQLGSFDKLLGGCETNSRAQKMTESFKVVIY